MGHWPKPEILQVAPWLVTPEPRDNQFRLMANAMCTSFILQWQPKSLPQMACIAGMNSKPGKSLALK